MTDYSTDFTESSGLDSWTEQWHTGVAAPSIVADTTGESYGDECLKIQHSSSQQYSLSWDDAGSNEDAQLIARFRVLNDTYSSFRVLLRGSGNDTSEEAYHVDIRYKDQVMRISKFVAGSESTIDSVNVEFDLNEWLWVRFSVKDSGDSSGAGLTDLKAKFWNDQNEEEPASWDIETTDSSIASAGWGGVGSWDGNFEVDYFALSTGAAGSPSLPIKENYARLIDVYSEALRTPAPPNIQITQANIEVLRYGDSNIQVTQMAVETLRGPYPNVQVTQVGVEVLRQYIEPEAGRAGAGNFFLLF